MSAITALTAQNTMGVSAIMEVPPEFVQKQIDAIAADIFPDSVKIGMVSSKEIIKVIVSSINKWNFSNIVVDPVMVSTSGSKLISDDSIEELKTSLFPLATLITPNIPEAEVISDMKILSEKDMELSAEKISMEFGCSVLLKGGHSINDANDYLFIKGNSLEKSKGMWFNGKRIQNTNTHGTGCTLSSAIATNLAKGISLFESVKLAKDYISGALSAMLDLGKGSGPMAHNWNIIK